MRPIKFRGKRLDNGEWVFGDYCHHLFHEKCKPSPSISYPNVETQCNMYIEVDPDTIGQYFTTLPDGTELYEGDIVLIKDSVTATVVWSGHGFHIYGLEDANGRRPDYTLSNPMKRIGNIHDATATCKDE